MKNENKFEINRGVDLLKKFKNEPEPKIIWNGIIEQASGLITGVGKTGKTTFAENLGISLAVGRKSFYEYPLDGKPKKVLFLNLEEKLKRIWRRNKKQVLSLNKEEFALFEENYIVKPENFPEYLNTNEDWEAVHSYIELTNPEIIFLDSITHMCIGQIEQSAVAQQFMQNYRKYILSFDKTVFVIHHNTKGNDKPISQDSIAGSRVITQSFDFAFGFGNIPSKEGGSYSCMLFNKDAEKSNNDSVLYNFDKNYWIQRIGMANKFDLYCESKSDGRYNNTNRDLISEYILSKSSQDSQTTTSSEMMDKFVSTNTMSKQTLYASINHLLKNDIIQKTGQGIYLPVNYNLESTIDGE